jgi:hypothetical protein
VEPRRTGNLQILPGTRLCPWIFLFWDFFFHCVLHLAKDHSQEKKSRRRQGQDTPEPGRVPSFHSTWFRFTATFDILGAGRSFTTRRIQSPFYLVTKCSFRLNFRVRPSPSPSNRGLVAAWDWRLEGLSGSGEPRNGPIVLVAWRTRPLSWRLQCVRGVIRTGNRASIFLFPWAFSHAFCMPSQTTKPATTAGSRSKVFACVWKKMRRLIRNKGPFGSRAQQL